MVEQVPQCHIIELYVKESARRDGVGQALLDAIEAWAESHDCVGMKLMVNAENQAAISLYKNSAYQIERHNMRKRLGDPE